MDRDEFMELVYETFADEPDNVLANGIIEAADAYVEHEKAQLSQEGTTSDLISRQAAIDALARMMPRSYTPDGSHPADEEIFRAQEVFADCIEALEILPSAQPEPQEGHWKKDEKDDCPPVFRQFRICSVCGAIETSETNYCPNCGAKMKISTK